MKYMLLHKWYDYIILLFFTCFLLEGWWRWIFYSPRLEDAENQRGKSEVTAFGLLGSVRLLSKSVFSISTLNWVLPYHRSFQHLALSDTSIRHAFYFIATSSMSQYFMIVVVSLAGQTFYALFHLQLRSTW